MKWISVKDKLPPLTMCSGSINVIGWDSILKEYIHC